MNLLFREHQYPVGRLSVYECGSFKLSVKINLEARKTNVIVHWMGETPLWIEIYQGNFLDVIRTIPNNNEYQDEVYDPIEERALLRATMILDGK